jgi:hypothetical protein
VTCNEIADELKYLNYDLSPKAYEMFEKLNDQLDI